MSCRPHLAAIFGFFELRTLPWSPSKVEKGAFYLFTLKVGSKYTYIILKAVMWRQQIYIVTSTIYHSLHPSFIITIIIIIIIIITIIII